MSTLEQQTKERLKEFNEVMFEEEYAKGVNMVEAYDAAESRFIEKHQARAYSNYQSFNSARFNRAKRELSKK
jgi:hypothetical protein